MTSQTTRLVQQLTAAFEQNRPALMPYFPLGYPDYPTSIDIVEELCDQGADIVELGIPFSDPLADGPTIQAATQAALAEGISVAKCLDAVHKLRADGISTPFVFMSYYNPILQFGIERFIQDSARVGINGLIVPDLPPEEAEEIANLAASAGLGLIFLITPNSPMDRIAIVGNQSTGFVYLVSLSGTTGARDELSGGLEDFVNRVRAETELPLALGFGISTPEQVAEAGQQVDGVIVGSALIDAVVGAIAHGSDPVEAAGSFCIYIRGE